MTTLTYGYYRDPVSRALLHSLRSMYYPLLELKTVLSVDPGAMTRMLDRLACKGWIERLPNPADKRGVLVQLTPDGAALASSVIRLWVRSYTRS